MGCWLVVGLGFRRLPRGTFSMMGLGGLREVRGCEGWLGKEVHEVMNGVYYWLCTVRAFGNTAITRNRKTSGFEV